MVNSQANYPEQNYSSSKEDIPFISGSLQEIDAQIAEIQERLAKGQSMITTYQLEHDGVDNIVYRRHYNQLKSKLDILNEQRISLANRQLSFQDGKYKKALAAFNELVAMTYRKEFETPRYQEQEELVRKLISEDEQLFEFLYSSQDI